MKLLIDIMHSIMQNYKTMHRFAYTQDEDLADLYIGHRVELTLLEDKLGGFPM